MKLIASIVAAALSTAFACEARAQDADARADFVEALDPDAHLAFEAALAPYGEWFDDVRYGRVWSPAARVVGADFAPYVTGGRWSLTQYGFTWTSTYPWGWAPFHYGRWVSLPSHGWAWVPGTTWGPAWVRWRAGDGFAGWAPLGPEGAPAGQEVASWRLVPASQLGAERPSYLAPVEVASVFPRTAPIDAARAMTVDERTVRYNAGPTGLAGQAAMREGPLSEAALPRPDVAARAGGALNEADAAPRSRLTASSRYWAGRPAYAPPPPPGSVYAQPLVAPPGWYRWGGRGWGRGQTSMSAGTSWEGGAPPGAPSSGYLRGGGQSLPGSGGSGGFAGGGVGLWGGSRGR